MIRRALLPEDGSAIDIIAPEGGMSWEVEGFLRGKLESIDCLVRWVNQTYALRITPDRAAIIAESNSSKVVFEEALAVLLDEGGIETSTLYRAWLIINPEVRSENFATGKIQLWPVRLEDALLNKE